MESDGRRGDCSGVAHRSQHLKPDWTAFGIEVRRRRLGIGLTQEALAHEIGISSNYLSDIERGRRNISINLLFELAAGLQASFEELFPHLKPGS